MMERQDDTPSTRDLAGAGGSRPDDDEPRFEREGDDGRAERAPASGTSVVEREDERGEDGVATDATTAAASPGTADVPEERRDDRDQPAARDDRAARDDGAVADGDGSLLPAEEESDLRRSWEEIQTRFVDDPRRAVQDADELVAGVMQRLAERFAQARDGLEGQWSRGEDVGTEELRVALQSYRSFFRRLLSA